MLLEKLQQNKMVLNTFVAGIELKINPI